jgi:hypothetical protein
VVITVVVPCERPVATSEFPDKDKGTGLQVTEGIKVPVPAKLSERVFGQFVKEPVGITVYGWQQLILTVFIYDAPQMPFINT